MTVKGLRDSVRPILTFTLTLAFVGVLYMCGKDGDYNEAEKLLVAEITTPLMMMYTYHFTKSSKIDK